MQNTLLFINTLLAQSDTTGVVVAAEEKMRLSDLLLKGGIIMVPIAILFMLAIYLLIERALYISKKSKVNDNFLLNIKDLLHKGDLRAASTYCKGQEGALSQVIGAGIANIGKSSSEIDSGIESVASYELARMEKNLSFLGIIAGIAPMLGFIGTISGIINIFYSISLTNNISIGIIAGGLYEKMITSGSGLVVGVFAYTGYHILLIMIDRFTLKMEGNVIEFKNMLQEAG